MTIRRGFTIIEVLCVVAIIVSLAAILYPVVASSKEAAYKTTCIANLRQIAVTTQLYTADNDDHYPYGINAFERIAPHYPCGRPAQSDPNSYPLTVDALVVYSPQLMVSLRCPTDQGRRFGNDHVTLKPFFPYNAGSSYIFADLLEGQTSSYFDNPSTSVWACDVGNDWHIKPAPDRFGVVNALAYDGHASTRHEGERGWPVWMKSWELGG